MTALLILILFIAFFIYLNFFTNVAAEEIKSGGAEIKQNDVERIASFVKKKYNELALKYDAVNFKINKYVSYKDILAIICTETGPYLLAGKTGNELIGDNGKAIGIMQIHDAALQDVNKKLGTNIKWTKLKDDEKNIMVGSTYLQICYEKAVKEKSADIRKLAIRKYNGGITAVKDNNNISISYYHKFEQFRKLL